MTHVFSVLCVIGLTLASGTAAAEESADAKALRARATQYWKYRVARDAKLYDFYAPPEKGGPTYYAEVSDHGPVQYTAFEITQVDVKGDQGVVQLRARHVLLGDKAVQVPERFRWVDLTRDWVRVDGVWYQKPRKPGLSVASGFQEKQRQRRAARAAARAARSLPADPNAAPGQP